MPKSSSGSPSKRSDHHSHHGAHHHYKKSRTNEFEPDEAENENYRYNDLRDRLNELRKSKEPRDRPSSSDRSKQSLSTHSSYQEEKTQSSYNRSKKISQETDSTSSSLHKSTSSQFKSDESSKTSKTSPPIINKTEITVKTEKSKLIEMMTYAEVSEIVSEEELSNDELELQPEPEPHKEITTESKTDDDEMHHDDKEELEESEAVREVEEGERKDSERSKTSSKQSEKSSLKQLNDVNESKTKPERRSRTRTKSTDSNKSASDRDTVKDEDSIDHTPDEHKQHHTDTESINSGSEDERDRPLHKRADRTRSASGENKREGSTPKMKREETLTEALEVEEEEEDKLEKMIKVPPEPVTYYCAIQGCRSVEEFECLNKIEEGAYGVVYRAKDKKTNEQVALKRLKMEKEKDGFPITSLREVDTLLKCQHPNIVTVREIVVGSNMDKIYMVMDFVEHDLKSLMQYGMKKPFLMSEVKCLMLQLLSGIAHLHDNWIIHRDLKTSNLLLSHKGVLKIADFGLAREYGSPLKEYTPVVVTLWYRSPELLLNTKKYSTSVDMWSVGCIFGELMLMKALFPGKNEKDQLDKIFKDLGTPTDRIWPEFKELPLTKKLNFPDFPYNTLRSRFGTYLSDKGYELVNKLLTYDPVRRLSAEDALKHEFFKETPLPIDPSLFPTWPAKSEGLNKKQMPQDSEPRAPSAGKMYEKLLEDEGFVLQAPTISTGFQLRI